MMIVSLYSKILPRLSMAVGLSCCMCPTLELCEYFLPAAMAVTAFIFVFITCTKVISMFFLLSVCLVAG